MKRFKIFYGSSYDRGLDVLLFMWPNIKERFPQAELHICYGWNLFDIATRDNPERKQWKASVETMMQQDGIFHHGRVGKEELTIIRQECGIWAYPTYFTEINCITALESQRDGLVPVATDLAALKETVGSGIKVAGDIRKVDVQNKYLEDLLRVMGDEKLWEQESSNAKRFANGYEWKYIARDWNDYFNMAPERPLVSIITVTIRRGFWNVMAANIASQTYKNVEWIIVDDYKQDRSELAKRYSRKYNIKIKYVRGDKALGTYKRPYAISKSNNIGLSHAEGELTVWLQDFILMPLNGVEKLVTLSRHNPNSIIAPVDEYWFAKEPNKQNEEDWWDGNLDIVDKFSWRNVRCKNMGIRETTNPYDFEMNYGAIPTKIAHDLGGWYELFDGGIGFDNTDIAYRATLSGYSILVDDTNVAVGINIWPIVGGTDENVVKRETNQNNPRWYWFKTQIDTKNLPLKRDKDLDEKINLSFKVPADVSEADAPAWIEEHSEEIARQWQ